MSVAILAAGAVVLLGALGNISHAVDVAEQRSAAYLFSVSKMAELELALQEGETFESHDGSTSSIGPHRVWWSVTGSAVSDDPQLKWVTLTVASRARSYAAPQHVETFLRTTLPEPPE